METVTAQDMEDARLLGERSGLNMSDDWDQFIHDVAQTIADGRRGVAQMPTLTVGMVTAMLAAIGEHEVPLSNSRRRDIHRMWDAAMKWKPSVAAL